MIIQVVLLPYIQYCISSDYLISVYSRPPMHESGLHGVVRFWIDNSCSQPHVRKAMAILNWHHRFPNSWFLRGTGTTLGWEFAQDMAKEQKTLKQVKCWYLIGTIQINTSQRNKPGVMLRGPDPSAEAAKHRSVRNGVSKTTSSSPLGKMT